MAIGDVAIGNKITAAVENLQTHELNGLPLIYQAVSTKVLGTAATTIGASQSFPAVTYASTVEAVFVGILTNSSGTNRTPSDASSFTGSGVTYTMDAWGSVVAIASSTLPLTFRAILTIPANTAASLQLGGLAAAAAVVSVAGGITYKQLPQ